MSFRYDEKRYEDKTFIPEANSVGSNNSPISRAPKNVTEEKKNDESLADVLADLEKPGEPFVAAKPVSKKKKKMKMKLDIKVPTQFDATKYEDKTFIAEVGSKKSETLDKSKSEPVKEHPKAF